MDPSDIKDLFDDKYERLIGESYDQWQTHAPQTQDQAYKRCDQIDHELNRTYEEWFESTGERKDQLQDQREKIKAEYELLVDAFNLEFEDRSW